MTARIRLLLCALVAIAALSACDRRSGSGPTAAPIPATTAAPPSAPLVLGETFNLESKLLSQRRLINVYLPPGYAQGAARYPVMYMPDGGLLEDFPHILGIIDVSVKNQTMRPFILVGIENIERRHDLAGPSSRPEDLKLAPHAGGADAFRAFIRNELKPAIAARYRIDAESAIVGESLAGLFVTETLFVDPDLFDSYIAISPSLWWNDRALARGAAAKLQSWPPKPKALYFASADDDILEGIEMLAAALRESHPAGLTWYYQPMPGEHHGTIFHGAALKAFRTLFAPPAKVDQH